jgi:hypothetical protein
MNMQKRIVATAATLSFGLALVACAQASRSDVAVPSTAAVPAPTAGVCDATPLGWAVGQLADEALVERARRQAGAELVRVLRPGMMVTREFNAARLDIRVDNERKVLATSCG